MGHLYTKYKIFHFNDKLKSLPLENPDIQAPIHIRIKPTNVCAHNCWYCAYRAENLQLGKDMIEKDYIPKEKMFEIIDDCSDMGVKAITFSGGGDPFYYRYLTDTVKKLTTTNIAFASLTNGAKIEGEIAELFAHYGTWLRISIDGYDDASYARYRNIKEGEFTKILNNIYNFKKLNGKCLLGVCIVTDKDNWHTLYDMTKKLKELGVDSVKIAPCIVSNDGRENNLYHEPFYQQAKELAMRAKEELSDENFEVFDAYHEQLDSFDKEYDWCPYLQINPVIGADLNVYSCHDKAYNLDDGVLFSIKERSFKEGWLANKEKNFFSINPSKVCNHHCVVHEKNKMLLEYLSADKNHLWFV